MNFQSIDTYTEKETPNSTNFKFDISVLEEKIREGGIKASKELKDIRSKKKREGFISAHTSTKIINLNERNINGANSLSDLLRILTVNKINLISRNQETREFNVHTNEYLLEELNFINKYLGPEVNISDKRDIENTELAKLKAKRLTRACGLRYKVRDLLMGIK